VIQSPPKPRQRVEIKMDDLYAIVRLSKEGPLTDAQRNTLELALRTLAKRAGIGRRRRGSEKTDDVLPEQADESSGDTDESPSAADAPSDRNTPKPGHGRNSADAYGGATRCRIPHESLKPGDICPACGEGKLYELAEPAVHVRIVGQTPLGAEVVERQRLRCNPCGEVFTAAAPDGVTDQKYDATAVAMVGLLKYGTGVPFHRLERLQGNLEIPLPASTQWDIVASAETRLKAAFQELIRQAAQGEVIHNDDTKMRVLSLSDAAYRAEHGSPADRTGSFTSGIVATGDGFRIALYFTGWKHAGENLGEVLSRRAAGLPVPIQMCDGLSHNVSADLAVIIANCLPHARRKFVEIVDAFPEECRTVIVALRDVYRNDALTKERNLSKDERLQFHQAESAPIMAKLLTWLNAQLDQKLVEPNSSLGDAMRYMLRHWEKLTLFLRVAGAPLDNNIAERALKRAIQHRKNSLFYRTLNGARVGDTFQSLIHTAELNGANPFDYLTALVRHAPHVERHPEQWLPWNYRDTVKTLEDTRP
jgi:transposase